MRLRGKKRYLAVALLTAGAVMAAGLYLAQRLPGLIPKKHSDEVLREWIETNSPAKVEAGFLTPLFYPGLGIQVRGLRVALKDTGEEMFRAGAVKVVIDEAALIHGRKVVVREIIVERPVVTLALEPSCKWNAARWARKVPAELKARAAAREPDSNLLIWRLKDALREFKPTADTSIPGLMALDKIRINDAEIHIRDECDAKRFLLAPVDLYNVNVGFDGAAGGRPARVSLALPFPPGPGVESDPLALTAAVAVPSKDQVALSDGRLTWAGVNISALNGTAYFKPEFKFDANIAAEVDFAAAHRAATWAPVAFSKTIPDMEGKGGGAVVAHVWGPDKGRAAKVHYTGEVRINKVWWWPGRVIAPIDGFSAVVYLEDGKLRMPETTANIGGNVITAEGTMTEAKNPRFNINASTDFIDFTTFFKKRKTPYALGKPMLVMKTNWGGEARIKEGVWKKIKIGDARGVWSVTNQRVLTFSSLSMKACGGSYTESGRSFISFNHPTTYNFRFDGRIRGMDMTSFVDQLLNTTIFLHGKADADGFITGQFEKGKFITRSLSGELKLAFRDGYFEGFNAVGKIFELFKLQVPAEYTGQKYQIMTADVKFNQGVAATDNLYVESGMLRGEVRGWIDFASAHCDLKIKLNFARPITGLMRDLPLVGVVLGPAGDAVTTVYVRVRGHWDRLEYAVWDPRDDSPPEPPEVAPLPGGTAEAGSAVPN